MTDQLLILGGLSACFLLLFALAELAFHRLRWPVEWTRKLVHAGTGFLTLLFPVFLESHWQALFLCGSFLGILLLTIRFSWLPSIHAVTRRTSGSWLYPITVYGCFALALHLADWRFFYLPILVLALADPVAALVGKRFPWQRYVTFGHGKTLSGSLGFLTVSGLVTLLVPTVFAFSGLAWMVVLRVAVFSMLAEAVSHRGVDNLTVPGAVVLALL